jgi:hypothetical protein
MLYHCQGILLKILMQVARLQLESRSTSHPDLSRLNRNSQKDPSTEISYPKRKIGGNISLIMERSPTKWQTFVWATLPPKTWSGNGKWHLPYKSGMDGQ